MHLIRRNIVTGQPDQPTATDLYCGGGGSTEALAQAGFWTRAACNHDPISVATHQLNHPGTQHFCENLRAFDYRRLPSTDVLWASPSCVWHARAGGRKRPPAEIERQQLDAGAVDRATANAVVEAAEVHRYPVIIVENVAEFMDWTLFDWWADGPYRLDYSMQWAVLDAADFGHAQFRPRWYAVFTQPGISVDLTPPPPMAPVYASAILEPDPGPLLTRRLYVTPQIEAITEVDTPYLVTYRNHAKPRRADTAILPTITAGGNHHAVVIIDRAGRVRHRLLTNLECSRAQGFPDEYQFVGPKYKVKRQIGNAVPVGVARHIATRVALGLGYSVPELTAV